MNKNKINMIIRLGIWEGLLNNLIEIKNQYTNVYRLEKTNHKTTIANIGEFSKIIYKFNH